MNNSDNIISFRKIHLLCCLLYPSSSPNAALNMTMLSASSMAGGVKPVVLIICVVITVIVWETIPTLLTRV